MRVIFPFNPAKPTEADGPFQQEHQILLSLGVSCSLFDYDQIDSGVLFIKPTIIKSESVLYRGWMLEPSAYDKLSIIIEQLEGKMFTPPLHYLRSHHLPGWYDACKEYTAETIFLDNTHNITKVANDLGWDRFFVKDYVKSNYNERGSIAHKPSEIIEILEQIEKHRGSIEGGISLRKVEEYLLETEQRYFVVKGKAYSEDGIVPDLVHDIVAQHQAPFYSIDMIQRSDGVARLIEIGDGQVSDIKSWDSKVFCQMLAENLIKNTVP